jgi:fibro-slime domain-containing protein
MSSVKKIALTLSVLLALLASDAAAQCAGKTIYFQVPDGWSKTSINIMWENNVTPAVTASAQGAYSVFTFPSYQNDGETKTFYFSQNASNIDNGDNRWVASGNRYGTEGSRPGDAAGFACSLFGASDVLYIYPDPGNPSRTVTSTLPPNAYNFYFLPPKNDEWVLGTPSLVWNGGSSKSKFSLDNDHCGWLKLTWFNEDPPEDSWVWLNAAKSPPDDKLGAKGLNEDPLEWPDGPDGNPTPFNLRDRFGGPGDLYYNANGDGSWSTIWPGTLGVCEYKFAALIYDTDKSVNPSFTTNDQNVGCGGDQYGQWTSGVVKGMVKTDLNPATRKIECDKCTQGCGAFSSVQAFNDAFNPASNTNVVVCYDMPFTRTSKGLWEFDSDKMVNHQGRPVGGFYPEMLQSRAMSGGDYSQCNACDTKYKAESFVNLTNKINPWCFERGFTTRNVTGEDMSNCGAAYGAGAFAHGGEPADTWGGTGTGASGIPTQNSATWNNDWRNSIINLWGGAQTGANAEANSFYCFESHAEFTYENGQQFFFRGDDDIWVYMNNKLVVDLGGSHLAAPAYVDLGTLGLTEGEKYPIDIFFCDRRTTMSNVRITTNMYFSQNSGLYVTNGTGSESKPAELCMLTGGGGSCSDLAGGGGSTAKEACGGEIRNDIEYFIENRRGDLDSLLWTPPGSAHRACTLAGDKLTCYGGIVIDLSKGSAYVNKDKLGGITGSWTLYARVKDKPEIERVKIASFSTTVNVRMAWGSIVNDRGAPVTNICDYTHYNGSGSEGKTVTGERFPVCFAVVGDETATGFEVNEDGAGSTFTLKTEGFKNEFNDFNANAGLKVYTDSTGDNEIPYAEIGRQLTIPASGVLVLWVTGDYKQRSGTHDYKINVGGRTTDEVTLHSLLPRLQWTKGPGSTDLPCPAFSKERGWGSKFAAGGGCPLREDNREDKDLDFIWVGEALDLNLRAYNELSGKTCKTCSFSLTPNAVSNDPAETGTGSALVGFPPGLGIVDGEASFAIRGNKEALFPKMTKFIAHNTSSDLYMVEWDSLQFKKPPVPVPEHTEIYDEDGDGIGDYIKITYSRGFRRDSLPNMLEVKWDVDSTGWVRLGKATKDADDKYPNKGYTAAENEAFWSDPDHKIIFGAGVGSSWADREGSNRAIDNALEFNVKDTVILKGKFSKNVLTQGDGTVVNWTTFRVKSGDPETTTPLTGSIDEKIPAIIVRARYAAGEGGCDNTIGNACNDRVVIEFSERVKIDPAGGASDMLIKNPIAYKLIDFGGNTQDWGILNEGDVPAEPSIKYASGNWRPSEAGDSVLNLVFKRWRQEGNKSGTPMPGDSVKFAALEKGYVGFTANVFVDLKGNRPNPAEWGRQIEGRKPFTPEKIPIGSIDPNSPTASKDSIIQTLLDNGSTGGFDPNLLFNNDRPIELLPVPPDWNIRDVQEHFPGTVGMLFNPDISNEISDLCATHYPGKPCEIKDSDITIYPRAFYHTNLGNFVADNTKYSGDGVKCNDKIFPVGDNGQPSCRASKSQFYVAWDMKDMKGRFVGTGAYVGLYDFRWEVYIDAIKTTEKKENIERKVEMHGVKRIKKR